MSWNCLSYSPKRFHISFSFSLDSSCFLFFQQFVFFSYFSPVFFGFLTCSLTSFSSISLKSSTLIKRLLFKNRGFISYCFIVSQGFSQEKFPIFFVLVHFEDNVEIALQIKTMPSGRAYIFQGRHWNKHIEIRSYNSTIYCKDLYNFLRFRSKN